MKVTKFGERIKELREQQNILQRQLAAALEMDTAMLSKIERGERKARKEHVVALAAVLNSDVNDLMIRWLADQVYDILKDENNAAAALKIAESEIKYRTKNNKD